MNRSARYWLSAAAIAGLALAGCGADEADGSRLTPPSSSTSASGTGAAGGAGGATGVGGGSAGAAASGGSGDAGAPGQGGAGAAAGGGQGAAGPAGVDPSNGKGGTIGPGMTGPTPLGAVIRIPKGYDGKLLAAPVIWLFNEEITQWSAIADAHAIVLIDLDEYNDMNAIVGKLNGSITVVESQYNVDRARYYWAGWSAGGNIAIILGAQNQDGLAGTMVFPGTGGNIAQPYMLGNQGHKIRLFYACGDQDQNFAWQAVQNEAQIWKSYGYETSFVKVAGAAHYLDESAHQIRAAGWAWMKGFNLKN